MVSQSRSGLGNDANLGFKATKEYGDMLSNQASIEMANRQSQMGLLGSLLGPAIGAGSKFILGGLG